MQGVQTIWKVHQTYFHLIFRHQTVTTANGSTSSVAGKGSVLVSRTAMLNSVLRFPNLLCNLISTSKLRSNFNWIACFRIRGGIWLAVLGKRMSLFILDEEPRKTTELQAFPSWTSRKCEDEIKFWHLRS